jgi:hypothetical protein
MSGGTKRWLGVAALCLVVLCTRAATRLLSPGLWAEDGSVFLKEALELGVRSLWTPYAGYLHTLPRMVAFLASRLPLVWYAPLVCVFCLGVYASTAAFVGDDRFAYLLPSPLSRGVLAVSFCFVPGLDEVLGNLTNLHWVVMFYLGLLALGDPDKPLHRWEIGAAALVALTDGIAFVFTPVFLFRWGWKRLRKNIFVWREAVAAAVLITSALPVFVIWLTTQAGQVEPVGATHLSLPAGAVSLLAERFLVQPWVGAPEMMFINRREVWEVALYAAIALAALAALGRRVWTAKHVVLGLVLAGMFAAIVAIWIVRPGSMAYFARYRFDGSAARYSFIATPFALILWAHVLDFSVLRVRPALLFCSLTIATSLYRFSVPAYDSGPGWREVGSRLDRARATSGEVFVPASPEGWGFSVTLQ